MSASGNTIDSMLIVDDDPILRTVVEAFFRKSGVSKIMTAENGRVALNIVDERGMTLDCIMCDLNMPELDGFEFLRHLKDSAFTGRVVILSGEDNSIIQAAHGLANSHSLDIAGTLNKPLNLKDLEKLISEFRAEPAATLGTDSVVMSAQDLRLALHCGQIVPHYQPKICVESGTVIGVEALARWVHPGFGVIAPVHFISLAEQNGLIGTLTELMLTSAIADAARMRDRKLNIRMSVNITAEALDDLAFPDRLAQLVGAAGIPASMLTLEITEDHLLKKTAASGEVLGRLRIKGFGISIDDFGTGYANIEQLREFPFTELKIDQSFIRNAARDNFARACVESSVNMARKLGLRIVAEGVETTEDMEFVRESAIDEAQGFLIAKAMPVDGLVQWLADCNGLKRRVA